MMSIRDKNVLVTGGAGFIGSHLVDRLAVERPNRLVVVDNFSIGKRRNLVNAKSAFPRLRVYSHNAGEMSFMRELMKKERIDIVFNLAVLPLPMSLTEPRVVHENNVRMTQVVCELLRLGSYESLIHFSSSEVYGTAETVPMSEEHPLRPTTPYGASKVACDHLVQSYVLTFGIEARILRPFNNYGPRQNEGTYAGVIPLTIKRILSGQPPVIYGDGFQTRDYTYVTDTAEAALLVSTSPAASRGVFNVASGVEVQIKQLVTTIAEITGWRGEIQYGPPRVADVRRHCGDSSRLRTLLGFSPKVDLVRGLRMTIDWYRKELSRPSRGEGKNTSRRSH